jgi:hypothetical protein
VHLDLCTIGVAGFDNLVRCKLRVKLDAEVVRIFGVGRGAPVDTDTLQAGVFYYCHMFDVQLCFEWEMCSHG